jgi:anti-sigma factor RsiW
VTPRCATIRGLLDAYCDGELSLDAQILVQAHLRECTTCSAERQELLALGVALRSAAARQVPDEFDLGRTVLPRLQAERSLQWSRRFNGLFEDLHLVWSAMGATVATLICVFAVFGLLRAGAQEQPTSMAALIGAMAQPGSNENPVRLDGRRMLLPRSDPDALVAPRLADRDEAVFALSTVVTKEGRVIALKLLQQDVDRAPVGDRTILALLDVASQARFEPARSGGGSPVAVNMVWLLAQTRVVGKVTTLGPTRPPQPVSPISELAPTANSTPIV